MCVCVSMLNTGAFPLIGHIHLHIHTKLNGYCVCCFYFSLIFVAFLSSPLSSSSMAKHKFQFKNSHSLLAIVMSFFFFFFFALCDTFFSFQRQTVIYFPFNLLSIILCHADQSQQFRLDNWSKCIWLSVHIFTISINANRFKRRKNCLSQLESYFYFLFTSMELITEKDRLLKCWLDDCSVVVNVNEMINMAYT